MIEYWVANIEALRSIALDYLVQTGLSGRGSLVVKVFFHPNKVAAVAQWSRYQKLKRPPLGVVWSLGEGWCQLRCHPRHLTGSKLRGPSPKALVLLNSATICGHSILVVKVMVSWLACHESEPSKAEDPPCREGQWVFSMLRLKRLPVIAVFN
ncbi:hypothetical protein TNCV_2777521 [Trichonephila clavipes]|nr:hypothetical protein TNCV_2777521 [Trichonephila clavipes]